MTAIEDHRLPHEARQGPRLSDVLREMRVGKGEFVTVGDIVNALGTRGFAPLMVIFSAPNVFLFIPGSSLFTAVPLMFLAVQLIRGRPDVWLPDIVARRSIARSSFERIARASLPHVERFERLARPRAWPTQLLAQRTIGVCVLILAIFLFLPIPFANGIPALSIITLALALGERDGYWLVAGLLLTVASNLLVAGLLFAGGFAALELISSWHP